MEEFDMVQASGSGDICHPSELTLAQRRVLSEYWRVRGEGEMGAERYFMRVLRDLRRLGAPQTLIGLAERGVRDERKHGLWGRDWAVFFGSEDESDPTASRTKELQFPGASNRDNAILRIAFLCFTETVGCHVLSDIRPRIVYEPLRELNRQHLADETVHSRVGWAFMAQVGVSERRTIQRYLPLLLGLLPKACCEGKEDDRYEHLVPLGYLTPRVLYAAHERAVDEVIVPGLAHLGFGTQHVRSNATDRGAA